MGKKTLTKAGLTKAEEAYCQAYAMNGGNGSEAYRRAFPKARQSKDSTVSTMASKLNAKASIRLRISVLGQRVAKVAADKFDITAEKVLQELAAIAFANSDDYYQWGAQEIPVWDKEGLPVMDANGKQAVDVRPFVAIKPSGSLTRIQKAAIAGAEMTFAKDGSPMVAVKMADKRAALKDLGQHLKLFGNAGVDLKMTGGTVQLIVSQAEDAL